MRSKPRKEPFLPEEEKEEIPLAKQGQLLSFAGWMGKDEGVSPLLPSTGFCKSGDTLLDPDVCLVGGHRGHF